MKVIEFVIKQHPIWVTSGYLGLLAGVFFKYTSAGASLSLNELGDYLAGAFAPLAFYWLVLGFFQQGKELQNSVDALNQKAIQLKQSASEQSKLVSSNQKLIETQKAIENYKLWQELVHTLEVTRADLENIRKSCNTAKSMVMPTISGYTFQVNNHRGKDHLRSKLVTLRSFSERVSKILEESEKALSDIGEVSLPEHSPTRPIPYSIVPRVYKLHATASRLKEQTIPLQEEASKLQH
ncbi:hypothetical protein TRM7557_03252 [Tritonibacter multivorans]|uniref:Uncharacterized protein n=1 Tax=Tritonibacter multivorans TaxID=928856 RepID=A0A0P1GHN5_9RHOB|nr:hypothetical protein [Tritonibacter multivorans]MDA7420688.1 hypothetical protein [Tritonibacter multivorans]CUH81125.1 hypothetical protein TRM7557_03252 [Tritonibacter multivorans]SFC28826.1 hypothetical protein SAMN04488049_10288 [Tritonibacter multivorans]